MFRTVFTALFILLLASRPAASELSDRLTALSADFSFSFKPMDSDTFFSEKYVLYFRQPLDHNDTGSAGFTQRVFLSHRDFESPVVFITEGYAAEYAAHPRYINELTGLLTANQVCAEHRYFGESTPDSLEWKHLTVFNAATDHHRVVETLQAIYTGHWVSTGISKGGQTTMYHRYFYPDDVTASVGYVCPLNFSIEDKRVYRFLEEVGDAATRDKVRLYQVEMLKNKARYLPEFEALARKRNLDYAMGIEQAYELTVLEYSFAYWQWGSVPAEAIPVPAADSTTMIRHLDQIAGLDWISTEGIRGMQPFFYQALTEIGFYGYDISGFEEWVSFDRNPTFDFTAPGNLQPRYDPEPMIRVDQFIRHEAENMIFIYGEDDPWSATAVDLTLSNNLIKVVKPGGSHMTRIGNLPAEQQKVVMNALKEWLGE